MAYVVAPVVSMTTTKPPERVYRLAWVDLDTGALHKILGDPTVDRDTDECEAEFLEHLTPLRHGSDDDGLWWRTQHDAEVALAAAISDVVDRAWKEHDHRVS